jgi:hypothetical protein
MKQMRARGGAAIVVVCLTPWSIGCGGSTDAPGLVTDASDVVANDASSTGRPGNDGPDATTGDASKADDGTAAADGGEEGDEPVLPPAPVAGFDPAPSGTELCESAWQQGGSIGEGTSLSVAQMVVDSANNAYVAFNYGSPSNVNATVGVGTILGVASSGYAAGVAIAKIDPSCNVVWVRELGVTSANGSIQPLGLAIDSASNVTIAGSSLGAIALGDATLDAGAPAGDGGNLGLDYRAFLLRLDASGHQVFSRVFVAATHQVFANAFGVDSAGTTTLLALAGDGVDFGAGPQTVADAGATALPFLVRFDATGAVISQQGYGFLPYESLQSGGDGHVWATTVANTDAGTQLLRLGADGGVEWSTEVPAGASGFASNAAGQLALFGTSTGSDGRTVDVVFLPAADGGPGSPVSTPVSYATDLNSPPSMALDEQGRAVVGGLFYGSLYRVSGGLATAGDPRGVGFQAFDEMGALKSIGVRTGSQERFLAMGMGGDGNVAIVGSGYPDGTGEPSDIFFLRMSRDPGDAAAGSLDGGDASGDPGDASPDSAGDGPTGHPSPGDAGTLTPSLSAPICTWIGAPSPDITPVSHAQLAVDRPLLSGPSLTLGYAAMAVTFKGGPLPIIGAFASVTSGLAVLMFDAECELVSVYEASAPAGATIDVTGVGMDNAGSATVLGAFSGDVDFGGGPAPDAGVPAGAGVRSFMLGVTTGGELAFLRTFTAPVADQGSVPANVAPVSLAVDRTGQSSAVFSGDQGVDFGGGPATGTVVQGERRYFVQFDRVGAFRAAPTVDPSMQYDRLAYDPGDVLWASAWVAPQGASAIPSRSLLQLDANGAVLSTLPYADGDVFAVGSSNLLVLGPDNRVTAHNTMDAGSTTSPAGFSGGVQQFVADEKGGAVGLLPFPGASAGNVPAGIGYVGFDSSGRVDSAGEWPTETVGFSSIEVGASGEVLLGGWRRGESNAGPGTGLYFVRLPR